MNKRLRYILLLPISILYGIGTSIRNWLYNKGYIPIYEKPAAIIAIGNLTMGGTGKTPHVEFIISNLHSLFKIAMLSRGYKRKTKGFVLAEGGSNANMIGDEPFQVYQKYKNIPIAVCEDRSKGIDQILQLYPKLDAIILDDAYQHRKVKAGLSILLTDYNRLHTRDHILPGGNLRESRKESKRANIIIVTKCPQNIDQIQMKAIEKEIKPTINHEVYFSKYVYGDPYPLFKNVLKEQLCINNIISASATILLVTGIVSPRMILEFLSAYTYEIQNISFRDHHDFTIKDIKMIEKKFFEINNQSKYILVTEKDAVRLIGNKHLTDSLKNHIFVLPIRVEILNNKELSFITKITDYVTKNSRDCQLYNENVTN